MRVSVVGAGPAGKKFFTEVATDQIVSADCVLTSKRLEKTINQLNNNIKVLGVMEIVDYINNPLEGENHICVVASGDVGFYSIASTIKRLVTTNVELEFISGISSFQYFTAKLQMGYENMKFVSLHGKEKSIVPYVCYNENVFSLTGGAEKAHDIIRELIEVGMDSVTVSVGENLGSSSERIVSGTPRELADLVFEDLSVLVVNNKNYVNHYTPLTDDDFIRGKSPMTKESIRNLSVEALSIAPTDVVYDIGAGTGSVTVAMARRCFESTVYAIEKEDYAIELIHQNIEKCGAYNIKVIENVAPLGIEDLPPADKVFIGGSTGKLKDILDTVLAKNPNTVVVVNAVTLETIAEVTKLFEQLEFETETICINVSKAQKLGRYNLMKAENPVYIIKGAKPNEPTC
ncbi:MAG: precorrin-6y C5,15-methyltransferase (decarboxylating) subunit CbiE [Anaerovoracaceae bacterium]